jgi:hypothetical protein
MDHTRPEGYAFDEYLTGLGENGFDEEELLLRWLAPRLFDQFEARALQDLRAGE